MRKKIEVPYISQLSGGGYCGVGALHMIVNFYGVNILQRELLKQFKNYKKIKEEGAALSEISIVARKLGFSAREFNGLHLDDLIAHINEDLPIIANCKCHWNAKTHHCYVAKGYDDEKEIIYVNDPAHFNKKFFHFKTFNKLWDGDSFSNSLLVKPK